MVMLMNLVVVFYKGMQFSCASYENAESPLSGPLFPAPLAILPRSSPSSTIHICRTKLFKDVYMQYSSHIYNTCHLYTDSSDNFKIQQLDNHNHNGRNQR